MAGFLNKLMDFIGIEETDMEEEAYMEEEFEEKQARDTDNVLSMSNRAKRKETQSGSGSSAASFSSAAQMKMILYHPVDYNDTQNIIDNLKSRKPVIVNMEELEIASAQRILDFMAGAVYALNGTIRKVSQNIFVLVPTNYDVIGNGTPGTSSELY